MYFFASFLLNRILIFLTGFLNTGIIIILLYIYLQTMQEVEGKANFHK